MLLVVEDRRVSTPEPETDLRSEATMSPTMRNQCLGVD